ncbi:MAG TPA: hypothetical protein VNO52_04460 [Methylomirabilota bacterium]|nr:hypothetical protein [Methylomirabilota bacterium]
MAATGDPPGSFQTSLANLPFGTAAGIRVELACQRLPFLHAVNLVGLGYRTCDLPAGAEVARHVMHFRDGTREEKPVMLGEDVWNWQVPPELATSIRSSAPCPVWAGANFISLARSQHTVLFLSTW